MNARKHPTKQLRVGVLCYDLQPFTADLLERLQDACNEIKLTAYPCFWHSAQKNVRISARPARAKARPFGVRGNGVQEAFTSSVNITAAWRLVVDNEIIILHGLQGGTALLVALFAKVFCRPVISVNHSLAPEIEQKRRWWIRWLKRMLLASCERHISQMPAAGRTLSEVYGVPPRNIDFAPFEGGASLYRPLAETRGRRRLAARSELGVEEGAVCFLFVGNLIPLKGPDILIEACALLKLERTCTVIAGPEEPGYGPEGTISYYTELAKKHGLNSRLRILGPKNQQELADLYSAADVFVLPTWKDCMPKVFIEAALFGLPIVTTNAPGSIGLLPIDGNSGYSVPVGDPVALARAMSQMLCDSRREKFSENIRKTVDEFCDCEKEIQGFRAAILKVIQSSKVVAK